MVPPPAPQSSGCPGVGGCLFPTLSWHGSWSQAQCLTGEVQSHGGQDSASLPPPQGRLAAASPSGSQQAHSWDEWRKLDLPFAGLRGQGAPAPSLSIPPLPLGPVGPWVLSGVGMWSPL